MKEYKNLQEDFNSLQHLINCIPNIHRNILIKAGEKCTCDYANEFEHYFIPIAGLRHTKELIKGVEFNSKQGDAYIVYENDHYNFLDVKVSKSDAYTASISKNAVDNLQDGVILILLNRNIGRCILFLIDAIRDAYDKHLIDYNIDEETGEQYIPYLYKNGNLGYSHLCELDEYKPYFRDFYIDYK